jgi:hypothetical protein
MKHGRQVTVLLAGWVSLHGIRIQQYINLPYIKPEVNNTKTINALEKN